MLVQVIELGARTARAAMPTPGAPQVWTAEITAFESRAARTRPTPMAPDC